MKKKKIMVQPILNAMIHSKEWRCCAQCVPLVRGVTPMSHLFTINALVAGQKKPLVTGVAYFGLVFNRVVVYLFRCWHPSLPIRVRWPSIKTIMTKCTNHFQYFRPEERFSAKRSSQAVFPNGFITII